MAPLTVGLDSGLTATKAVVFDAAAVPVGHACLPTPQSSPQPHWMQRDPEEYWRVAAAVLRAALVDAGEHTGRPAAEIAADVVAVTPAAHGDGVCLVDEEGRPVGPMLLFTDTRAASILHEWAIGGVLDEVLPYTGQVPLVGGPTALLAWLRDHDPATLRRARWLLYAKDWLRFRLTGTVGTDRTDAAACFTEVGTQTYSLTVATAYGLADALELLPAVSEPASIAGAVTEEAAQATGLVPGTLVATGLHDVQACLLGATGGQAGQVCVIGGTVSVNLILTATPVRDRALVCRSGPWSDSWAVMAVSPASTANLDWALAHLADRGSVVDGRALTAAVDSALANPHPIDAPTYVPYLFGGPAGAPQSAGLLGLRSWHHRDDIIRAVVEGITFNHCAQIQQLRERFDVTGVHLTGGAGRNRRWAQLFADVLGCPVSIPAIAETGALGAAMCAAAAAGVHLSLAAAAAAMKRPAAVHYPDSSRASRLGSAYADYRRYVSMFVDQPTTPAADPSPARHLGDPS